MSSDADALSRPGSYLRQHRLRLTLWIAVIEGLLTVVHVLPRLALYALAAVALVFWFGVARNYRSNLARQSAWIFAASQSVAVLVPIVWAITKFFVAIVIVVVIAVAALYFLFAERDRADRA
jgi:hypothetical protein